MGLLWFIMELLWVYYPTQLQRLRVFYGLLWCYYGLTMVYYGRDIEGGVLRTSTELERLRTTSLWKCAEVPRRARI